MKVFGSVLIGAVVFIGVKMIADDMITGTDIGSKLFGNLVPFGIAASVVFATFKGFAGGGK